MKTMKKVLISLSVCAILVTCMVPCSLAVSEEDHSNCEIIAPKYEVISYITTILRISDSGRADCEATVNVISGYRVELTAELQQKDGSKWETIHDWEASGSNRISVSGPWYVMPGYSYRLKVTATTYDSNDNFVEAPVEYSNVEEY